MVDDYMTHEERQARTSSELSLLADRARAEAEARCPQSVMRLKRGDRVRVSGSLFELLHDVDGFLVIEE